MPCLPGETRYGSIGGKWAPGTQFIRVEFGQAGPLNAQIPVPLVRDSGDNTHRFLAYLCQLLVREDGVLHLRSAPDLVLEPEEAPSHDDYFFTPATAGTSFTETRGPEGKTRFRAPVETGDDETISDSSRATPTQVFLACCPEETSDTMDLFQVQHGILLQSELHRTYDKYYWSLYVHVRLVFLSLGPVSQIFYESLCGQPKSGRYYFHAFNPKTTSIAEHIGKSFGPVELRNYAPPDPRLCAWHYRQCVQMYLRGYSVEMQVNKR
ncbi:hypothetical protein Rhopal_003435-T1 [Rhodotorula paludigena]|uniref:Uncharacterized protein n=1 Tax=Rhodotorula paludigena TaxID=86838 RepID=A0AAV5GMD9_9BASI|nr:hypothetical protein Rhopal_003435-T1 [Rhodotorula paludigena]